MQWVAQNDRTFRYLRTTDKLADLFQNGIKNDEVAGERICNRFGRHQSNFFAGRVE